MKITSLEIRNFKAIRHLDLKNLGDVVVVAGPNGCGKSCILDAIRFLKASYAGYRQQDDWQHFFSEFQLDINNPNEVRRLFYDPTRAISITAKFELAEGEVEFVRNHGKDKLVEMAVMASRTSERPRRRQLLGQTSPSFEQEAARYHRQLVGLLSRTTHEASVTMSPAQIIATNPNVVFDFIFRLYEPDSIGIIDYHGAHRTYGRERVGGINVNIKEANERIAQHALFNWQNKYSHIKSELAGAYVRDLLAEKAGADTAHTPSILETMKELFELFLPGKRFDGPRPGTKGELSFPVRLQSGAEHDIDDLSSGEKELVYGYLRLRNVAPRNSIILLDEPELHLNPRLVLGLPSFYRKHLGLELNNQLWMTTHSDAFLRDSYKSGGFNVFHMSAAESVPEGENQAVAISADSNINRAGSVYLT